MKKHFLLHPRRVRRQYALSIFLHYVSRHPGRQIDNYPPVFPAELGIGTNEAYSRQLLRQRYLERAKDGTLTVTAAGLRQIRADYVRFYDFGSIYVTILEYEAERRRSRHSDFCVTMRTLLLRQLKLYQREDDYTAVTNLHRDIARLYAEEHFEEQSAYHDLVALYLQTSGLPYYDALIQFINGKRSEAYAWSVYRGVYIEPRLMRAVGSHSAPSEELVQSVYQRNRLCINLCNIQTFTQLATEIANDTYDNSVWQQRFSAAYGKLVALARERRAQNLPSK